ncbi:MAG: hypothetical protein QOJ99_2139 [Bryobacterales bacterium]|nr:hypothetical protein [Bryobacterales bacterium]
MNDSALMTKQEARRKKRCPDHASRNPHAGGMDRIFRFSLVTDPGHLGRVLVPFAEIFKAIGFKSIPSLETTIPSGISKSTPVVLSGICATLCSSEEGQPKLT